MNNKTLIIIIGAVIIISGAFALTRNKQEGNNTNSVVQNEIPEKLEVTSIETSPVIEDTEENAQTSSSTYLDYSPEALEIAKTAQKSGRKVVLFFYANWCPFCLAADSDFKAQINTDEFPENLTLLKTDYDTESELRNKYGVTYQHTFVQIDADGNQLSKWISGETAELAKNLN